jgi:hypothetical protein
MLYRAHWEVDSLWFSGAKKDKTTEQCDQVMERAPEKRWNLTQQWRVEQGVCGYWLHLTESFKMYLVTPPAETLCNSG